MPIRDIVLTLLVAVLLPMVFKHPVLGAYLWAWLGLMSPHKLTYGFAFSLPFSQATAGVTLLALLFTRRRQAPPLNVLTGLLVALVVWMSVTSLFAIAPSEKVLDRWIFVMKIQLMLFVTWMLVLDARQLRVLVWVVTLSVAFFGVKGGLWTVMTGGGGRVWGPPGGLLEGNNELAAGLVMLMPMLYFLRQSDSRRWVRTALTISLVFVTFSILGSQSRGALLGLLAIALLLGLKSKYPIPSTLGIVALVGVAIAFMPDTWSSRMETISSYQADGSAMSRIWTWKTLWNAAVDRPLIGAGFRADSLEVFGRYAPTDGDFAIFTGRVYVAHSIYFQMLGEHGFVGLFLFLALGLAAWLKAGAVARRARDDAEFGTWMPLLMRMSQVSLLGYGVSGAFLSLAYLDLPYYILGFVVLSDGLLRRSRSSAVGVDARAPAVALPRVVGGVSTKRTAAP